MTRNEAHTHDLSTLATFKDGSQAISNALAAFGWLQSSDMGQVVWTATVLTLTQVTVSSGNGVYSYSSFTGPVPRVGMSVTFSGFTNSGNNVTAALTAVSGGSSGTVTVSATTQVNETNPGSGTTTAISSVPASGSSVYEIWQPGDGLQTFFLRIDYANNSSQIQIKFQVGTTTNGAGALTGTTMSQIVPAPTANSGTAVLFNCLFCGDSGSFACMMWRDLASGANFTFSIDRSRDGSGNPTGTYINMLCTNAEIGSGASSQQHLFFGIGATSVFGYGQGATAFSGPSSVAAFNPLGALGNAISSLFNGTYPFFPIFPAIGYFDNPMLGMAMVDATDFSEGSIITCTIYGAPHAFVTSKVSRNALSFNLCVAMRWE